MSPTARYLPLGSRATAIPKSPMSDCGGAGIRCVWTRALPLKASTLTEPGSLRFVFGAPTNTSFPLALMASPVPKRVDSGLLGEKGRHWDVRFGGACVVVAPPVFFLIHRHTKDSVLTGVKVCRQIGPNHLGVVLGGGLASHPAQEGDGDHESTQDEHGPRCARDAPVDVRGDQAELCECERTGQWGESRLPLAGVKEPQSSEEGNAFGAAEI